MLPCRMEAFSGTEDHKALAERFSVTSRSTSENLVWRRLSDTAEIKRGGGAQVSKTETYYAVKTAERRLGKDLSLTFLAKYLKV
jgi:hypothetical protein